MNRWFLSCVMLAPTVAAPAFAQTSRNIATYIGAASTAALADKVCHAFRQDVPAVMKLKEAAAIPPADAAEQARVFDALQRAAEKAFEQDGEIKWCATAWRLYGPLGTLAPGVLRRR